jgi:hypothetical protein
MVPVEKANVGIYVTSVRVTPGSKKAEQDRAPAEVSAVFEPASFSYCIAHRS